MRKSKQKESIIKVLKSTNSHPNAEWVFEHVKKEVPKISLGTVYRNLKLLKQADSLQEVSSSGGMSRFDGRTDVHYHFYCDRCGDIFDLDEAVDKAIEKRIARRTGFKVTHHNLEFHGLCLNCKKLDGQRKINNRRD